MILLTFAAADGLRLGVRHGDGVIDVMAHAGADAAYYDPRTFYTHGQAGIARLRALIDSLPPDAPTLDESTLDLRAPLPVPGKIICIGLNYRRHAAETGAAAPTTPILFSKFANALAHPGEAIPIPSAAQQPDYEAELAVIIGAVTRNVSEAQALDYVLGYANANDISARDLQTRTSQWLLGKTLDKFMPIGPYLVTADAIPDPQTLPIRLWLNGEPRQDSNTGDMIFSVAQIIAYLSAHFTLEPGDIILTGTPEGVILGMKDKVWLKPGDSMVVEIEGLGRLENTIAG